MKLTKLKNSQAFVTMMLSVTRRTSERKTLAELNMGNIKELHLLFLRAS